MQKPIRYYITKSGEEPTVRSVKVALGVPLPVGKDDAGTDLVAEPTKTQRDSNKRAIRVKRIVKDALQRRPSDLS